MDRDNATWLAQLDSAGAEQHAALSDLREALLRGLRRALSDRPSADESLLEDAAQDALVRILERLHQFEGRSRFLTWATSIAIHLAIGELRRRRWKDVSLEELAPGEPLLPLHADGPEADPESRSARRDVLRRLGELLESELSERQRLAIVAELRGMPQEEVARRLGISRNAVYKLGHDARRKLRRGLEAAGLDAAAIRAAFS